MKILYIANVRIPTERAHGLQIMKMCQAFGKSGVDVELVVSLARGTKKMKKVDNLWEYYGITVKFKITRLFSFNLILSADSRFYNNILPSWVRSILFLIQDVSFCFFSAVYSLIKKPDVIYSRSLYAVLFLSFFRRNVVYEVHDFPKMALGWKLRAWALRNTLGLVTIADKLKEYHVHAGIPGHKIFVAADGVDLSLFKEITQADARKELGIPQDKKVICYTGHLDEWKGVYVLAEGMKFLPGCLLYVVGGNELEVKEFKGFLERKGISNTVVIGHVRPTLVPVYLAASDVAVLPKTSDTRHGFSPLKLFDYMASRRPIVATSLAPTREILNDDNAVLVAPDDAEGLAKGIKRVLEDRQLTRKIAKKARRDVEQYTWDTRAERILEFIGEKNAEMGKVL